MGLEPAVTMVHRRHCPSRRLGRTGTHLQLLCQVSKALEHRVALKGARKLEQLLLLVLAEVRRLEQLLRMEGTCMRRASF